MSLVGPRPLLMQYLNLYTEEQASRHEVKPGITGWAQVNGRNSISWEEKFRLDVEYVNRQSFLFDLKILFKTVLNVLRREGISANGQVTMEEFTGKNWENDITFSNCLKLILNMLTRYQLRRIKNLSIIPRWVIFILDML